MTAAGPAVLQLISSAKVGPGAHEALADPWSLGHFCFGVLQGWLAPVVLLGWKANCLSQLMWEALENSPLYLRWTARLWPAQGYHGDTLLNSGGDVLFWSAGYAIGAWTRRQSLWRRAALYVLIEAAFLSLARESIAVLTIDMCQAWARMVVYDAVGA